MYPGHVVDPLPRFHAPWGPMESDDGAAAAGPPASSAPALAVGVGVEAGDAAASFPLFRSSPTTMARRVEDLKTTYVCTVPKLVILLRCLLYPPCRGVSGDVTKQVRVC